MFRRTVQLVAVSATIALAACGGADEAAPAFEVVDDATIGAHSKLPVPDEPILTIDGALTNANQGDALLVDLSQLEGLETVEATIDDPFEGRPVRYTGVWLSDVLELAGATGDTVGLHALDDYAVSFDIDEIRSGDALIATRSDGALQPIETGGPIRLVFTDADGPGRNDDLWIWNIDVITVD